MDLNSIMIGSGEPGRLRDYYAKLFGEPAFEQDGFSGWQLGNGFVTVGPHDAVKGENPQPGRLMWNLESSDVTAEFERIVAAGGIVVQEPYHPGGDTEGWIATLADPDGNYFQLMSPMSP